MVLILKYVIGIGLFFSTPAYPQQPVSVEEKKEVSVTQPAGEEKPSQVGVVTAPEVVAKPVKEDSVWSTIQGLFFDSEDKKIHGFITYGFKPVRWYNDRLDADYMGSSFDTDVGSFNVVEFGLHTSKDWALKIALPEEKELIGNFEYLRFLLQGRQIVVSVETGGFKGAVDYEAANTKPGTLSYDPVLSDNTRLEFDSGYRKIAFGYKPDIKGDYRWEFYYYAFNKPYFYDILGIPNSAQSLDNRSSYEGYFVGINLDTYDWLINNIQGEFFKSYFSLLFGLGYGKTKLSEEFAREVSLLTNQNFSRDMDPQVILNEKLEFGWAFGNLKTDSWGYMGSFGAFLDWDLPITNAKQTQGDVSLETSSGIVSVNMDIFYGLIFKATILW